MPVWVLVAATTAFAAVPPALEQARARRDAGDLRGALAIAEAVAAAHPADAGAWALAGDLRYAAGDRNGARAAYEAARAAGLPDARIDGLVTMLRARPGAPLAGHGAGAAGADTRNEAAYVRALTAFNAGQHARATELAAGVVAAAPGHHEAWALLGRCRLARGDRAGAREAFGRSLALSADQPEVAALQEELHLPEAVAPVPAASSGDHAPTGAAAGATAFADPARAERSAAPPVLPGPVRTGEQAFASPPPATPVLRERHRPDAEWPLPESPDRSGAQGPLGRAPGGRRAGSGRAWSFGVGAGVAGHGLAILRDRADESYEDEMRSVRASGGTASVESGRGGPRAPLGLEVRMALRPGAGLLAGLELAPSTEDVWRLDEQLPFSGLRGVRTERRRTGWFGMLAGGWLERAIAPGWRAGGSVAAGGLYAWLDQITESELWWSAAGPPDRLKGAIAWGGWGFQADLAGELSRELTGPLSAWIGAGWRFAWVPRMSAQVPYRYLDGNGVWHESVETRTVREPDRTATRFDFSAFRAALGVRVAL